MQYLGSDCSFEHFFVQEIDWYPLQRGSERAGRLLLNPYVAV